MVVVFAGSWWALMLRGLAAVIFGVLAFLWPQITITALVFLFGAYALVDGVFAIAAGIKTSKENNRWWLMLISGVLSVAAGIFAFLVPAMTAFVLLVLIASWAIVTGAFQIAAAIQLRKHIKGEWLLALSGVFSILFGAVLLFNPGLGALAVVWIIGGYAIVLGIMLMILGFKLRSLVHSVANMTPRTV